MALLNPEIRGQIKLQFQENSQAIMLHVFTQEWECRFCRETRELVQELAGIAPDKVKVEVHNFAVDKEAALKFRIDKIPAIAVVGAEDYGIRFYGVPAGYEFTSLLLAVKIAASGHSGLSQASIQKLGALTKPVHLKTFVTATCPHCPKAVHMANQLAIASSMISAEMIEATEFPHLMIKEQVMGVPKVIVTGYGAFEGALPEPLFVDKVIELVTGGAV
jgi:glutaredoxin-like protein